MRSLLLLCLLAALLGPSAAQIKHVIVVMEENRSFDHFLGWLKRDSNPKIDGLTGAECNPTNTSDPKAPKVCVNDRQPYIIGVDPSHSVPAAGNQVYGQWPLPDVLPEVAPMNGFVQQYLSQGGNPDEVVGAFNSKTLPITSTLATEFAVFDRWFCSVAGPTQPNRFFLHSATSDGMANNNVLRLALGMPQKSIYESLSESGISWTNYFQEVPSTLLLRWTRLPRNWNFKHFNAFERDCNAGTLPSFSFIDPRYFDFPGAPQNDNHPGGSDVRNGEALIKRIYETLRNSPSWEDSLLIVTYDEHGGFYDHVPPPNGVPNPDGKISEDPYFTFDRLGVRVPTIMISPWIEKGTVVNRANGPTPTSEYEASSIPATLKKIFNLKGDFLTKRDAWAGTFEQVWANRTSPRTDCPTVLPDVPTMERYQQVNQPVDDLQKEFIAMAGGLNGLFVTGDGMTEFEASLFIKEQVSKFFGQCMYEGEDLYDGEYCKKN